MLTLCYKTTMAHIQITPCLNERGVASLPAVPHGDASGRLMADVGSRCCPEPILRLLEIPGKLMAVAVLVAGTGDTVLRERVIDHAISCGMVAREIEALAGTKTTLGLTASEFQRWLSGELLVALVEVSPALTMLTADIGRALDRHQESVTVELDHLECRIVQLRRSLSGPARFSCFEGLPGLDGEVTPEIAYHRLLEISACAKTRAQRVLASDALDLLARAISLMEDRPKRLAVLAAYAESLRGMDTVLEEISALFAFCREPGT